MLTMTRRRVKLTAKRQATLPVALCEELGVGPGDQLELERCVVDGAPAWVLRATKPDGLRFERTLPLAHQLHQCVEARVSSQWNKERAQLAEKAMVAEAPLHTALQPVDRALLVADLGKTGRDEIRVPLIGPGGFLHSIIGLERLPQPVAVDIRRQAV
jgi:bifunctional DNA-binding transcriptional regulator/antitoxin component of YhaV-PrlF toxin-antitoxin module